MFIRLQDVAVVKHSVENDVEAGWYIKQGVRDRSITRHELCDGAVNASQLLIPGDSR